MPPILQPSINIAHPLVQAMRYGYHACAMESGGFLDLVATNSMFGVSSAAPRIDTPEGKALRFDGTTRLSGLYNINAANGFSGVIRFRTVTPTAAKLILGFLTNVTTVHGFYIRSNSTTSTTLEAGVRTSAGVDQLVSVTGALTANKVNTLAFRYDVNTKIFTAFLNGQMSPGSTAANANGLATVGTNQLKVMGSAGNNNNYIGDVYLLYWYERSLDDTSLIELSREPEQVLQYPQKRVYYITPDPISTPTSRTSQARYGAIAARLLFKPASIVSSAVVGTPSAKPKATPNPVLSSAVVGVPSVKPKVIPSSRNTTVLIGLPSVKPKASPNSILSSAVVGSPAYTASTTSSTVTPNSVPSSVVFGANGYRLVIKANSRPSNSRYGVTAVKPRARPTSVISSLVFGLTTVRPLFTASSRQSAVGFGTTGILPKFTPTSRLSTVAFGPGPYIKPLFTPSSKASNVVIGVAAILPVVTPNTRASNARFGLTRVRPRFTPNSRLSEIVFGLAQVDLFLEPELVATMFGQAIGVSSSGVSSGADVTVFQGSVMGVHVVPSQYEVKIMESNQG